MKFPVRIPRPARAERTQLPAALAALLVLLFAVQLALPPQIELPDTVVGRPLRLKPLVVTPLPADPAITDRPLFSPKRSETVDVSGTTVDKAAPLGGARVVGLMAVRGAVRVFIQAPDGSVTRLAPGGVYQGWRLIGVTATGVTAIRGSERAVLPLTNSVPPVAVRAKSSDEQPEEEQQ